MKIITKGSDEECRIELGKGKGRILFKEESIIMTQNDTLMF